MSTVRNRRAGSAAGGRRVPGRPLVRAASRPVPVVDRQRTATRPAPRRPGRRTAVSRRAAVPERRPFVTGRAVLLGVLVLLLALTLTGPVRQWLAGRAEITRLTAEGTSLDARARELRDELRRQQDPAFLAREARERLTYVLPGDRLVVVVDATGVPGDAGTLDPGPGQRSGSRPPWYEALLHSIATADG